MKRSNYFDLLSDIASKHGISIPLSEDQLISNADLLAFCIDELLVEELIEHGLHENDIPNLYGKQIESAIDYYNKKRGGFTRK